MATQKLMRLLIEMTPIDILGVEYDIVLQEKKWMKDGTPGTVNFPLAMITLDTSLSDNRVVETLLHEIMEVIIDRFTIKEMSHTSLCTLEFSVLEVLRKNFSLRQAIEESFKRKGREYEYKDFFPKEKIIETTKEEELRALKKKKKKKSRKNRKK